MELPKKPQLPVENSLGSTWAVNAGTTMVSANNFDVVSGSPDTLPGLAPLSSTAGGLYNNGSDWSTAIWATRQLDTASRLNFAQSRTVYFSFRVNNTGDTAMGIGLADGNTGAANFVGVGAHWDNAGGGTLLGRDPQRDMRWRVSPNLTWYPSEFSKVRLQYNYDDRRGFGDDHSVWLQFEFLLGAHAAHKF